ncbi:hypothetical protein ABC337_10335 [Arthrobacter sp. 1P04PC]
MSLAIAIGAVVFAAIAALSTRLRLSPVTAGEDPAPERATPAR